MPILTVAYGTLLLLLGLFSYFGSVEESVSPTALIPAAIGVIAIICGVLALKDNLVKHAMHAAAVVGLLALLATAGRGFGNVLQILRGGDNPDATGPMAMAITAAASFVFVAACIDSFIQVRRARNAAARTETAV